MVVVFADRSDQTTPSVDDCHFVTEPVLPLKVKVPLTEAPHNAETLLTLPPTGGVPLLTVIG